MKKLLITDVDNTLFDWQEIWYRSFSAMMEQVFRISGVDADTIYDEIKEVHQRHGTSEYSYLLADLPTLKQRYGDTVLSVMEPAISAFRAARAKYLCLYPNVLETLQALRSRGVVIAAYTESLAFYTSYRFRKLGLDQVIDYLYSPPDHKLPVNDPSLMRMYEPSHYQLARTVHRHTPLGEVKPNPDILLTIIEEVGFTPVETVYVGDSTTKDIQMAQDAGVLDVHASYGVVQHKAEYELLRRVTHWTTEMVERERENLRSQGVKATIALPKSIDGILHLF